ncbi:putative DNA binding domain-containing protein [Candidatus Pacearchaeota archaeon]|nr:putative DNA binding domain-containing protein [Candidatus Pacearchaeota archaeon]
MNKQELIEKLEDIEWEDFEVKEAKSEVPKNSWETVSAFSNTAGGWIVFGVKKMGKEYEILGVKTPEKVEQEFIGVLRNGEKFNKKIEVQSKKYKFKDKTVLAFYIPQKHKREKPVYFNNQKNTFIRTGSGDQRATQEEIDCFFRNASFEEKDQELTTFKLEDLDSDTIKQYRNFFIQVNPAHRYNTLTDKEFLEKLGIIQENKITFAGLLLFGTEDSIIGAIPNYRIEYLEIAGISYEEAPTRYNYRLSSEKNLFLTFLDMYERLIKQIEIPFSVKQGVRDDDPPHVQALREALVNLIINTDYFSKTNSRIRVFSNRFEFFNPGALPKKIELILKEDFSLPRNPIIAKAFRFLRFSENIGSGFHKMINGWGKQYNLKPIIDGDFDYYKITFPKDKSGTTTNTTTYTTTNTTTKGEDKEKEILKIIENNPSLSVEQISSMVNLSIDGVRYHVKNLKKNRRIKRKGHGKGGSWQITN